MGPKISECAKQSRAKDDDVVHSSEDTVLCSNSTMQYDAAIRKRVKEEKWKSIVAFPRPEIVVSHPTVHRRPRLPSTLVKPRYKIIKREDGSLTWLTTGAVPQCFNQGKFDTCWAVTSAMLINSFWNIYGDHTINTIQMPGRTSIPLQISPQSMIDGIPSAMKGSFTRKIFPHKVDVFEDWNVTTGSYRTSIANALAYAKKYGVPTLSQYPYEGRYEEIQKSSGILPILSPTGYVDLNLYEETDKDPLATVPTVLKHLRVAPLAGLISCFDDFDKVKHGIYTGRPKRDEEEDHHAVLVTGSGVDKNLGRYFEIQNSNSRWGDESVGKVSIQNFVDMKCLTGIQKLA